uniref:Reverse transcriptase domain-containing protein n=1 Tax=Cannabis sativa TaxID=3483 RepID=A0A803Q9D0_CANSA
MNSREVIEEAQNFDEKAHTEARANLEEGLRREEIFSRQKSRVAWLKDGDRSTKFFMASTVTRRRRNYIQCLKNDQGESIENMKDIVQLFIDKFTSTFSKNGSRLKFNAEEWTHLKIDDIARDDLLDAPSEEEVLKALASMGINKAPGPDGFPLAFFRSHWDTIRVDFIKFINHFFATAELPQYINYTNIVLVPKKDCPSMVCDFRPIALCNVQYKCISKIITTRLRDILPSIISPTQTAFIKGRCITENTAIAKEIIHSMSQKKGSKGFMMIKLDMEKAYDKMDWDFLMEALSFHGFKNPLLGWIKSCIQIQSMNVLINGVKQGSINPTSGLRQGDPLSPTLFIVAADLLSRLLQDYTNNGRIKGFKVTRTAPSITHLMFADDVVLFGQATIKEAQAFMECLQTYCAWSGQAVNLRKSTVFFSKGVPRNRINDITSLLGMCKMKNDASYLGIPLFRSKKRSNDMQYLVQRVLSRIEGWKSRLLSKAGRTCLVQSVRTSIPLYVATSEVIPSGIANKMEQGLRKFWWGDNEKRNSIHTISWSSLCKSKFKGGLGIRRIKDFNSSLLLKWGWKLITDPQNLWCSIMNEKYLKGRNLFDVEKKGTESMLWKAILKSRPLLKEGLCRKIGDGTTTSIWFDAWVPNGEHMPQPLLDATQGANLVSYFINENMSWNEGRVRLWFNDRDSRNILNIGLPAQTQPDASRCLTSVLFAKRERRLLYTCSGNATMHRQFGLEVDLWGVRSDQLHCTNWISWMAWFLDKNHRPQLLSFDEFMTGALYIFKVIWEARNEVIHGSSIRPIMEAINLVNRLYNDHRSRWNSKAGKSVHKRITDAGWWNCCTDVSIQPNHSFGAAVFRDHMDRIVLIYSERFSATDPTLAEASMLASAAEYAMGNLKGKVVFYCDNDVVVANCSTIWNTNQVLDIKGVADRFKSAVRLLEDSKLRKVDRIFNFLAHNSAKWAAAVNATGVLDLGSMDVNIFSDVREWAPD